MFKNSEGKMARIRDRVVAGGKAIKDKIKDTVGDATKKIASRAVRDAVKGAVREANELVEESEKKAKKA